MPICPRCKGETEGIEINGSRYGCYCEKCTLEIQDLSEKTKVIDRITRCIESGFLPRAILDAGWDRCEKGGAEWPEITQWLTGKSRSLYIHGKNGVGKTFAARCILKEALSKEQPITCAEITAAKIVRMVRSFETAKKAQEIMSHRIILIDDVDKLDVSQNPNMLALFDAVNYAWGNGARFIVTSNLDKEGLTRLFKQSCAWNESTCIGLLDRLNPCETYHMQGVSRRRKQNA